MAKIKYLVKENSRMGTHSFYGVPVLNGTLSFYEVCEEACENTSIEPSIMRAAVTEYMKAVKRNVLKGFRVSLGDNFITVYPNLFCSVKDELNLDGTVKTPATAKMVRAQNGTSRLGATVSTKFSNEFANSVSWQKVDAKTGEVVEDEDITDENPIPDGGGTNPGGGGTTPDPNPDGGGDGIE
ncbi:MAG: hypothetical protein IK119_06390 [Bacteroidales bacterium]|nr:hypothetical protein [Bacteroidales bacterium]